MRNPVLDSGTAIKAIPRRRRRRRRHRGAEHEAQTHAIDGVLASAGLFHVVDRLLSHFGRDGLMAVLDGATAPQRVAAE